MANLTTTASSCKSPLDSLFERLINDRGFRKEFFDDPIGGLKKLGIEPTPELAKLLTNLNLTELSTNLATFNEKLVLCSSSGY